MGTIKTTNIQSITGSGTVTIGQSGETITVPSGATVTGALTNTPAFSAKSSGQQTATENVTTLLAIDTKNYDTDGAYDNTSSNYKFTVPSGEAGKYHFSGVVEIDTSGSGNTVMFLDEVVIYKNGSSVNKLIFWRSSTARYQSNFYSFAQTLNLAASDYVQLYARGRTTDSSNVLLQAADFSAHKLIGV